MEGDDHKFIFKSGIEVSLYTQSLLDLATRFTTASILLSSRDSLSQ
jgi:hypothetical protein